VYDQRASPHADPARPLTIDDAACNFSGSRGVYVDDAHAAIGHPAVIHSIRYT
jgi:hypothetical protein